MSEKSWTAKLLQELMMAPMKDTFTFTRDEVAELLATPPAAELAPVAMPAEVSAWVNAEQVRIDAVATYNARVEAKRKLEAFGVSVDAEYQAMCETQRRANALVRPMFVALKAVIAAPTPSTPAPKNCQTGWADFCKASQHDGVACPADSCDIDDGVRKDHAPSTPAPTTLTDADLEAIYAGWQDSEDGVMGLLRAVRDQAGKKS